MLILPCVPARSPGTCSCSYQLHTSHAELFFLYPAAIRVLSITKTHVQGTGTWNAVLGYKCSTGQPKLVLEESSLQSKVVLRKTGEGQLELRLGEEYQGSSSAPARERIVVLKWNQKEDRFESR